MSNFVVDSVALLSFTQALDVGPSKVVKRAFVLMLWAFFNFIADGS
jgi:hypothetical protein